MLLKEKLKNAYQSTVPASYVDHTCRMSIFHKPDISVINNFHFFNTYVISFLRLNNICMNYLKYNIFSYFIAFSYNYFSLTLISMYILLCIELLFLLVYM